jgi:hypothetical protein
LPLSGVEELQGGETLQIWNGRPCSQQRTCVGPPAASDHPAQAALLPPGVPSDRSTVQGTTTSLSARNRSRLVRFLGLLGSSSTKPSGFPLIQPTQTRNHRGILARIGWVFRRCPCGGSTVSHSPTPLKIPAFRQGLGPNDKPINSGWLCPKAFDRACGAVSICDCKPVQLQPRESPKVPEPVTELHRR